MIANVVMLSGEAFVKAIHLRTGKEFGITKIGFDTTLALLACAASLLLAGTIEGVREGTIIAALIVLGFSHASSTRRLAFVNKMITFAPNKTPIQPYEDNRQSPTQRRLKQSSANALTVR